MILHFLPKNIKIMPYADVAELADALDLGSSVHDVQVQVLSSALKESLAAVARLSQ